MKKELFVIFLCILLLGCSQKSFKGNIYMRGYFNSHNYHTIYNAKNSTVYYVDLKKYEEDFHKIIIDSEKKLIYILNAREEKSSIKILFLDNLKLFKTIEVEVKVERIQPLDNSVMFIDNYNNMYVYDFEDDSRVFIENFPLMLGFHLFKDMNILVIEEFLPDESGHYRLVLKNQLDGTTTTIENTNLVNYSDELNRIIYRNRKTKKIEIYDLITGNLIETNIYVKKCHSIDIISKEEIIVSKGWLTFLDDLELISDSSNNYFSINYYNYVTKHKKMLLTGKGYGPDVEYIKNDITKYNSVIIDN